MWIKLCELTTRSFAHSFVPLLVAELGTATADDVRLGAVLRLLATVVIDALQGIASIGFTASAEGNRCKGRCSCWQFAFTCSHHHGTLVRITTTTAKC